MSEVNAMFNENDGKKEKAKQPERIEVEIFGDRFALKTDDPDYMRNLAKLVDQQMRKTGRNVRSFDGKKIAVLTALQFADEYCQLKHDYDDMVELWEGK